MSDVMLPREAFPQELRQVAEDLQVLVRVFRAYLDQQVDFEVGVARAIAQALGDESKAVWGDLIPEDGQLFDERELIEFLRWKLFDELEEKAGQLSKVVFGDDDDEGADGEEAADKPGGAAATAA